MGLVTLPTAAQMLATSTAIRAQYGKPAQLPSDSLGRAAQQYARLMAHYGRDGHYLDGHGAGRRAQLQGFPVDLSRGDNLSVLENICASVWDHSPWRHWLASAIGHRQTLLSDKTHCGFGCAYSANGWSYWCALYGTPILLN